MFVVNKKTAFITMKPAGPGSSMEDHPLSNPSLRGQIPQRDISFVNMAEKLFATLIYS